MEELNVNTETQASEIEKDALDTFKRALVPSAKQNFMRDGSLSPMVFIMLEGEEGLQIGIMPAHDFMVSVEGKDALSNLMKGIGKNMSPVAICMITEMWMTVVDTKGKSEEEKKRLSDEAMKIAPSKNPDRIEGILCTFESENIQTQEVFKIVRDPELGLEDFTEGAGEGMSMTGRFVNVLRDMKKVRDN